MKMFKMLIYFTCTLISLCSLSSQTTNAFEFPAKERFKEGQKALEEFEMKARNSECWKNAIANIETGCKKLTDIEQSYLAIEFTNCHLKKSGKKTYNCSRDKSIEDCTAFMEDLAFGVYTTFFTHTTNICFYLQSQAWQERTEKTVSKLSRTSEEVADQLENSMRNQLIVLKHQNKSLDNQKQILKHEKQLSNTLKTSTSEAREAFDDMRIQANHQKALFSETFEGIFKSVENIKQLQSMLLGEFITLQSLAFHFVAVSVCYFFTSSPRTAGARIPLFVGLIILIGVERAVAACGIGDGSDSASAELVHYRLWLCRKVFIISATLGLLVTAYKYLDYNKINYKMLQEIQLQIKDMKILQGRERPEIAAITNGDTIPMTTSRFSHVWNSRSSMAITRDAVDSGENHEILEGDEVDETYAPDDSDTSSDYESIYSESVHDLGHHESSFLVQDELETTLSGRDHRRSGQQSSSTPRRSASRVTPSTSPSHKYNLRPRRSTQSTPYSSSFLNSLPSPATLEELVRTLHQSTARYTAVVKKRRGKGSRSSSQLFSSDEES